MAERQSVFRGTVTEQVFMAQCPVRWEINPHVARRVGTKGLFLLIRTAEHAGRLHKNRTAAARRE